MKKVFSILMVAVALMVAAPAQAQLIKFGVKGGLNLTEIDMKGGADWWEENTTGFFIGPMMEVTIPVIGLGVEAAVMYSQRGDHATKQQGIAVPLNLKYTIGLGSMLGIYVAAGPDFYFNFKDFGDFVNGGPTPQKKSTQVAINVGAGVKLLRKLQIGANYQIPVSNAYEWKSGDIKMKGWQASIAYIF